jgi:energy-coupling factor transporter ATP-binding protein EcfA2
MISSHRPFEEVLSHAAKTYPYPIAQACLRFQTSPEKDDWDRWQKLSRDVLQPILQYLTHLLLSDLVAAGVKPATLYHRIQSVLTRPMAGHFVGFLRETARYYREKGVPTAVPDLVDFLYVSEIESPEPLLGKLVDFRNLHAHGRIDDLDVIREIVENVSSLTALALERLAFLESYTLELNDGRPVMGAFAEGLSGKPQTVIIKVPQGAGFVMRPLLLKLSGADLVLLEDHDFKAMRLVYRGSRSFLRMDKRDLSSGSGKILFEEMKGLLAKVRSEEALLAQPDWESFRERSAIVTQRTLSLYEDMQKHVPKWYVSRVEWEGEEGIFSAFLGSDKSLLALNGEQGSGKSALVSHLAGVAMQQGHAVLFVNAQRFTFADVAWASNPYAAYFATALNYQSPLDKRAFHRLAEEAPESRHVLIFIDAINEVDGISAKWNRFRAMDDLLEWISDTANPRIKFILSFRLDLYKEYGYLQPEELPRRLEEIAFPGDNPTAPWITDIKSFDLGQAKRLYERLQDHPELGMAPAMTWEELSGALHENLGTFSSNPLLFTILLKSHHKLRALSVKTQEELFRVYSDRITDALNLKKRSAWARFLGFIRRGNITPKERFLTDMVEKMAEEGSAAFMADRLNPKNKRDQRLLTVINSPSDTTLKDLKEGGLIVEEKIELKQNNEDIYRRRFSYVAELMSIALSGVDEKKRKHNIFKQTLSSFLQGLVSIGLFFGMNQLMLTPLSSFLTDHGVETREIEMARGFMTANLLSPLLIFLLAVIPFAFGILMNCRIPVRVRDIGLIGKGFQFCYQRVSKELTNRYMVPTLLIFVISILLIAVNMLRVNMNTLIFVIGIGSALIAMVPGILLITSPRLRFLGLEHLGLKTPPRINRSEAINILSFYGSAGFIRKRRRLSLGILIGGIAVTSCSFLLPHSIKVIDKSKLTSSLGVKPLLGYLFISKLNGSIADFFGQIYALLPWISLSIFFIFFFLDNRGRAAEKHTYIRLEANPVIRHRKHLNVKIAIAYSLLLCVFLAAVLFWKAHGNKVGRSRSVHEREVVEQLGIVATSYAFDENGRLTRLDLSDVGPELIGAALDHRLDQLEFLKIPHGVEMKADLSSFLKLERLEIPASTIIDFDLIRRDQFSLVFTDPKGVLSRIPKTNKIQRIGFIGEVDPLTELPQIFPRMDALFIDEEAGRSGARTLPDLGANVLLEIHSEGVPVLDWMNESHVKNIISISPPPGLHTRNLSLVRRLFINGDGLEPEALVNATNLEWLLIRIQAIPSGQFWSRLRSVVDNELVNIKVLDIAPWKDDGLYFIDTARVRTARGSEAILTMLGGLSERPDEAILEEHENTASVREKTHKPGEGT